MFRKLLQSLKKKKQNQEFWDCAEPGRAGFLPQAVTMNGRWQKAVETDLGESGCSLQGGSRIRAVMTYVYEWFGWGGGLVCSWSCWQLDRPCPREFPSAATNKKIAVGYFAASAGRTEPLAGTSLGNLAGRALENREKAGSHMAKSFELSFFGFPLNRWHCQGCNTGSLL